MKKTKIINGKPYRIIITRRKFLKRVKKISQEIINDFKDIQEPPVLLFVLTGGLYFGVDTSRALDKAGFHHFIDTVGLKRYDGDENGGNVIITSLPRTNLGGKHVIVIEDIVDVGKTINYLNTYLKGMETPPKSIKYCAMFLKDHHEPLNFNIDYLGWTIGPPWVVGNGMDANGKFRGLEDLWECIAEMTTKKYFKNLTNFFKDFWKSILKK